MRSVLVTSPNLSRFRKGTVYTQKQLGLDDEQLDTFIAKGFGIEHDTKRRRRAPAPIPQPEEFPDGVSDDGPAGVGEVQGGAGEGVLREERPADTADSPS